MNPARRKGTSHRPARRIIRGISRLLLGLALMSSLTLPCIFAISEGGSWSNWFDIAEAIKKFFGNWTSAWLLISFMAFLPLVGIYLIAEAGISLKRWIMETPRRTGMAKDDAPTEN